MISLRKGIAHCVSKWALLAVLTATASGSLLALTNGQAFAVTNPDDGEYPWVNAQYVDAYYDWGYNPCPVNDTGCTAISDSGYGIADPWGYDLRNCTSFVAWEMNSTYGVNVHGWKNASTWYSYAPSPTFTVYGPSGYTPQVGDIADWINVDNGLGHVAYVYQVNSGIATLDEYNVAGTGLFTNNRTTGSGSQNAGTPDYYIHFNGSTSFGNLRQFYVSGNSWVAANVSGQANVQIAGSPYEDSSGGLWARDINNNLRQFYVSGTWVAANISSQSGVQISSNPTNGPGGLFARGVNGHLYQFYVSGTWVAADVTAQCGVSILGSPYEDSSGGLWARDTSNQLRQFYVSGNTWVAANPSGATGVDILSDPAAGSGGVIARDTNNHLRQFYVNNGWQAADITAQSGVLTAGNPFEDSSGGIWSRDNNYQLRQFYVSGTWVAANVSGQANVDINGDPNNSSYGLYAQDVNGHLRQFYVSGTWVAADITAQSGVSVFGNPVEGPGGLFSNT